MRARRSILNFASMLLYTGVVTAVGLFSSPWLEHWLGPRAFGGYRQFIEICGYLSLLELGLGGALAPFLARAVERDDGAALGRTVAAAVRACSRASLIMAVAGFLLTPVIPWFASGFPPEGLLDLRRAWLVLLFALLSYALTPFRVVIEARQQVYRINLLLVGQSLLITATALLLARAGWGITGQSLSTVLGNWVLSLVLAGLVLRGEPGLRRALRSERAHPDEVRALRALSTPALVLNLCGRLGLMTDNLIIGNILGVGAVTTLFFTQRLALVAQSVVQGVGGASWASLAELHLQGERDTFNHRLIELSSVASVLSAAALGPIVAYNRHFFAFWVGRQVPYGGDAIVAVAALNAVILSQTTLWGWCLSATGHVRPQVPQAVAWALVNIVVSILLTRSLGIVGPLLGSSAAFLAVSVWALPLLLKRTFGTRLASLARATLYPLAWGLPYTAGLWWIARHHRPFGWLGLAAEMGAAALGFLALCAFAVWDRADRDRWRGRLRAWNGAE